MIRELLEKNRQRGGGLILSSIFYDYCDEA